MDRFWSVLDRVVNSPYLNLMVGLLLVVAAIFELTDTLVEEALGVDIQAAHAILLLGLLTLSRAIEQILQGLEHVRRARATSARNPAHRDDRD